MIRFPCDRFDGRLASSPPPLRHDSIRAAVIKDLGAETCNFRQLPTAARQAPSTVLRTGASCSASLGRYLWGGELRVPCDRFDGGSRRRGPGRCRRSAFRPFPMACWPFRGRLHGQARPRRPRPEERRRKRCVAKSPGGTPGAQDLRIDQPGAGPSTRPMIARSPRRAGEAGLPRCQTAGRVRGKRFRPIEAP